MTAQTPPLRLGPDDALRVTCRLLVPADYPAEAHTEARARAEHRVVQECVRQGRRPLDSVVIRRTVTEGGTLYEAVAVAVLP